MLEHKGGPYLVHVLHCLTRRVELNVIGHAKTKSQWYTTGFLRLLSAMVW